MNKNYSIYLRPLTIFTDLLILNVIMYYFVFEPDLMADKTKTWRFIIVGNIGWLVIAYILQLYKIFRFTKATRIARDLINQLIIYFLLFSSLYAWSYLLLNKIGIFKFFLILSFVLTISRILTFIALRKYRLLGKNFRNIVLVGFNESSRMLYNFFKDSPEYGYRLRGIFVDTPDESVSYNGRIDEVVSFVEKNSIDEIYCTIGELSTEQIKWLTDYAENNLKVIKYIPDSKGVYEGNLTLQYYDFLPVLALRENPFDDSILKWTKRIFDVVFSIFVMIFIMSWLLPIVSLLIKIDSKGPVFYRQKRSGLANNSFMVYKFRTMVVNSQSDELQAAKNDIRVTKLGAFLRRTSIDELPQFLNVLKGEMSVVGPRPHMISHTDYYSIRIDKYLVRHMVKPGITGLAQIKGLRGGTETIEQMKARVRMDLFYIDNWSIFLDIKIVLQTVANIFKKDENAY